MAAAFLDEALALAQNTGASLISKVAAPPGRTTACQGGAPPP